MDPATGEVVEMIPGDLMRRLRAAKLALGIWGQVSRTATTARWFVFLDDHIRDQILMQWRETNQKRRLAKKRRGEANEQAPTSDVGARPKQAVDRGLRGFLRQRTPTREAVIRPRASLEPALVPWAFCSWLASLLCANKNAEPNPDGCQARQNEHRWKQLHQHRSTRQSEMPSLGTTTSLARRTRSIESNLDRIETQPGMTVSATGSVADHLLYVTM